MPKATPALEITTTEAPPPKPRKRGGKPVAIEEHTVVTKWAEEKKVGALPPKARKAPVAEEFEEDDEPEETEMPDSAHALFEEYGFDEGLMMDINRLPDYTLNRRTDPVSWQWVTMMPFTPLFKQEIALRHARPHEANWFLIVLKDANGRIIRREDGKGRIGPFSVEAASNEERQANGLPPHPQPANVVATINQATPPYPYPTIQPPAPVDEDAIIDREFSRLERLKNLLNGARDSRRDEPVQHPPQLSEEDIIVRAAMSSPDAQERVAKGLFSRLTGVATSENEMPWWGDIVKDLVMSVGPGLNALLQVGAQKMMQAQATVAQNGAPVASLPPQQGEQLPPQETAPPPAQEPPHQATPEDVLFAQIFGACQRRKLIKPEVCAKGVLDLVDAHAAENGYSPFTNAVEIFLSADMADIIAYAATQNPMAAKMATEPDVLPWLKSVQDEIRKEWVQQDVEDNQAS